MSGLEKTALTIGFVPLTDCAPLVVAHEKGFFARNGLEVRLSREVSWASVRDKLAYDALDAAQLLAPMPISLSLGLMGLRRAILVPMTLDLNGNGITVSTQVMAAMVEAAPGLPKTGPIGAGALRAVVEARRRERRPPLVFAHTYPMSTHHYLLRYWLATAGLEPGADVELVVVPPPQMPAQLAAGRIDGYCVGEPWNQLAVRRGVGRLVATSHDIWNNGTEKVLGVTADWAERHPATLQALLRALIEAGAWLDRLENRLEAARLVTSEAYVDVPLEAVAYPLLGLVQEVRDATPRAVPDAHVFHRWAANFPWVSHALWYGLQMHRAGQLDAALRLDQARRIWRPDLYRPVAAELGLPVPDGDLKPEGIHGRPWQLATGGGPLLLGPDRFIDGRRFEADLNL